MLSARLKFPQLGNIPSQAPFQEAINPAKNSNDEVVGTERNRNNVASDQAGDAALLRPQSKAASTARLFPSMLANLCGPSGIDATIY